MPNFYYGVLHTPEQLVKLFADIRGFKFAHPSSPSAEELFSLVKMCEHWDVDGEYDDVEETIGYLANDLLQWQPKLKEYIRYSESNDILVGVLIMVGGPIKVEDIEVDDRDIVGFKSSPLYPHLHSTPHIYWM